MDNEWTHALATGAGFGAAGGIVLGALRMIGKAVAWLVERGDKERREERLQLKEWEASLARREAEYRTKIEGELEEVRADQAQFRRKFYVMCHSMVEVTVDLRLLNPESAALARAEALLRTAFPADYEVPSDMGELLAKLDRGE